MNFGQKVYQWVKQIPQGKVATYGQVATLLGNSKAARAVGNALHVNPYASVPCHRVINRQGRLAINFGDGGRRGQKKRLLKEGVTFRDQTRVDLKKHRWSKSA